MAYPAVTLTTFRDVPWNAPFYTRLGFAMLDELTLPAGLAAKREQETRHGLPPETRCAMRWRSDVQPRRALRFATAAGANLII